MKTIFVVDDSNTNLNQAKETLGNTYRTFTMVSADRMFKLLEKVTPDLILLDLIMPEMNGFEALSLMKSNPSYKSIPVIFLTADSDVDSEKKGFELGASDYIHKPISPPVLLKRVELCIDIDSQIKRSVKALQDAQIAEAAAQAAADAANKVKADFLSSMSHEIRTPMNAIIGLTDILLMNDDLSEEVEDGIKKIDSSCSQLLGIINDLLDFSKIEAGSLDITPAEYNVSEMISDSIHLNLIWLSDKPVKFELQINHDMPAVLIGDDSRVKQILNNLLSNAIKYTDEGSVIFTVEHEPIDSDDQKVMLVLSVRDTGRGMTGEQQDELFSEYIRSHQERKVFEGTGLGLPITQKLVSLMGGEITVDSLLGSGSLFTVRLPQQIVGDEEIGEEVAKRLRGFRLSDLTNKKRKSIVRTPMPYGRVLVVDDIETNLFVSTGLMTPYKLQIDTVMSGFDAISKIVDGNVYDIVFMDHMMPEMDGMETQKNIRNLGYFHPIIALTANAMADQVKEFLKNGFDDFLGKPIDIRLLNDILNKYIRDKQPPEVLNAILPESFPDSDADSDKQTPNLLTDCEIDGLDIESGLERYDGNEDVYIKILTSYALSSRKILSDMDLANSENMESYRIGFHSLKGTSLDMFADKIGNTAARLEKAAAARDVGYVNEHLAEFKEYSLSVIDSIDKLISDISSTNEKPVKDMPDNDLLLKLIEYCEVYSMDGIDEVMDEIEKFAYDSDNGLAAWLREKVNTMEYMEIVEILTKRKV